MPLTRTGKVRAGRILVWLAALGVLAATDTAPGEFIRVMAPVALELALILAMFAFIPIGGFLGAVLGMMPVLFLWAVVDPAWWGENPWEARTFENQWGTRPQRTGRAVLCAKLLGGAVLLWGVVFCIFYYGVFPSWMSSLTVAPAGDDTISGLLRHFLEYFLECFLLFGALALLFFIPTAAIVGAILLVRGLRHPGFRPVLRIVQHPGTFYALFTLGMGRILDVW